MDFVSISGIISCHSCPLRYYLEKNHENKNEKPEYTIAKQISYHLGEELCEDEIWEEIIAINPEISDEYYTLFLDWLNKCKDSSWPVPYETDVELRSEKFGIRGRFDLHYRSKPEIGIIRISQAPENGIYRSDRIRAAVISICAESIPEIEAEEVLLHYIPDGTSKICRPMPADRRAALRALSHAKKIDRGHIPEKPTNPPCEHCHMKEFCNTDGTRLSDLI